jgi:cytochrome P450
MLKHFPSVPRDDERGIWTKLAVLQNASDPLALLLQMARNHRGCIPLQIGSQRVFVLTAAEHFKQVLATNSAKYGKYLDGMTPIFGDSMITMDGALWQKMRAIQQPAFHPDALADYVPHFVAAIEGRMQSWRSFGADAAVDISPETWALAAEMISRALFDRQTPFNPHFVYKAVDAFTTVTNHKAGAGDALSRSIDTWGELPELVLAAPPFQNRERTLLNMIEAAAADPAVAEFDRAQVLDEIKQYIWAGTETTALVLAWAMYLVATHPDVAERVRQETNAVYGGREPTLADYERLTYTRNVIAETMRMYPPIWSLTRRAEADDVIDGHDIKPGDTIVLWAYVAQHDPRYWDDPRRFDPERFGERAKAPAPYSYLPFGAGKRACIGSTMSQIEMVLALSLILREFDLAYCGEGAPRIRLSVVLSPNNGIPMRIQRRAQTGANRLTSGGG